MLMDHLRRFGLLFSTHLLLLMLLETKTICGDVPPHYWETPYSQPYFDNSSRREVTATVGQAALLHCRVRNLGDRAVSWIRKRDLHILTVGILTYTNDQRFQSLHTEGSDEWTLRISSPQPRDSGTYECQVSTEPKISQGFRLNVVVSRAKILGNAELFIKSGSDINLTCLAMQSPIPPSFIYWYKGKRVMNYSQRGGINVITERSTRTSKLLIAKATPADSGNYTCSPSSSDSASVVVHVINGEHPAAMQHGNSSANRLSSTLHGYLHRITRSALTTLAASFTQVTTTAKCPSAHPLDTGLQQRQTVWPMTLFWRLLQQLLLAAATTNWCIVSVGWLLSRWALQCGQWQHRQAQLQQQQQLQMPRHEVRRPLETHCWCWWRHWRRWSASASLLR
ncbi:uncharacterized protein LOC105231698 [Bactrocera dorsalis]|uniref:Uncharacterized protein LOC105231698 n=1 Tax=Bactrocera dorsalis TaxID=27457 RepID=A0ABM3J952_BACDO|nr:uncharacterized protein LOC105231698 [Bactrocera dorsalis]XP_049305757.1 uncharacterized protein LOC105231698 [Bactrocera dorsalis]